MSLKTILLPLLLLTFTANPLQAKEPAKILKYAVDSIYLLNADGDQIREIASSELPTPATVSDYNADLDLVKINIDGGDFWLDTMDLELDQKAGVLWSCKDISRSTLPNDSSTKAVMGMSKLCN